MTMRLNTLKPALAPASTRLRVGRGASAGQGKTCGRGVKGQRARKGGYHKVGFEGGQMPLAAPPAEGRLPLEDEGDTRRSAPRRARQGRRRGHRPRGLKKANIVPTFAERAKVVLSGEIKKAVTLKGIGATKGARAAIEKAGGTVEALPEAEALKLRPRSRPKEPHVADTQPESRHQYSAMRRASARSAIACCS